MLIGGILGSLFKVNSKIRSTLLHLAAGVIFAIVAIEILPKVIETHNIFTITIGFFSGLAVMLLIKHFSRKAEKRHEKQLKSGHDDSIGSFKLLPWGLLVGIAVDILLDGMLVGIGFAAGQTEGVLLCIALSLEILVLGLVVSTELKSEKFTKKLILKIISVLSMSIILGAFIGAVMLNYINQTTLSGVLAFGLSALMYLVTEELLVEAHENVDTPFSTAVFFVGFFVFLLIAVMH